MDLVEIKVMIGYSVSKEELFLLGLMRLVEKH